MKISPINYTNKSINFKSRTAYYENQIVEEDVASIENSKSYFSNPITPNQNFIGFNLIRENKNTIFIKSRYNHIIGSIIHNPNLKNPKINIISGSHQPVIELIDDELGIKILLNRGSKLASPELNISYDKIKENKIFVDSNKKITFGNNLYIVSGYKSKNTNQTVKNYFDETKNLNIEKSPYAKLIKNNYTIVGLAAGHGTRLKPISDLYDTNKPTTKFPGTNKTLMEISCLDSAARAGNISKINFIKDDENNLSGTAGPIINGLKNGTIPLDKPLVLLTSDTFNNIDLAKVLYDFEHSKNTGIGVVVKDVTGENIFDIPLIEINDDNEINKFHEKINHTNYKDIINANNSFYTSTNIMIIHPNILNFLKKFGDENNAGDFLEFLDFMHNVMNKNLENLKYKYPNGLGNKELKLEEVTDNFGYPKPIYLTPSFFNFNKLKVKAIYAKDIKNNNPEFQDIGTIEKFIATVHHIKNQKNINGIDDNFVKNIQKNTLQNGIIFTDNNAKEKYEKFIKKYDVSKLEGNVIITSTKDDLPKIETKKHVSQIAKLAKENPEKFVEEIMQNSENLKGISKELIECYGIKDFLNWYLSDNGYYGAYEKYVENLYNNANSIEELLKFMPNWSPWKLEEKAWKLQNYAYYYFISPEYAQEKFQKTLDENREQPFTIGELPKSEFNEYSFNELITKIRSKNIQNEFVPTSLKTYKVEKLKGGDLNDKNIYLISNFDKKFILKTDRSYAEDNDSVWLYDKKTIKKNKVLMADSNFTNACISKYLELNGCKNIPKLLFYDYKTDSALYEYVEDVKGDLFQKGMIDTEYNDLNFENEVIKNLREKGIYLNDTALKNFFTEKDGTEKIIDLGHANFIMPFKPGIKHYNIEFSNTNGPDLRTIYASLL